MSGEQSVFEDVPTDALGAQEPGAGAESEGDPSGLPGGLGAAGGAQEPGAGAESEGGSSESELEKVRAERDEYLDALRRLQADFDNFRKRTIRQQTELLERASESLCVKLLPVLDALDLAGAHAESTSAGGDLPAALAQIGALLRDVLSKEGLERIDAVNVPFDPHLHEAVVHEPGAAEGPDAAGREEATAEGGAPASGDGTADDSGAAGDRAGRESAPAVVVEVMRPGYRLHRKVLRPAMVRVRG